MTLADLLKLFYTGWRLILGALLISLVTAGIFLATTPSQYEATLLVRVGSAFFGSINQLGTVTKEESIENNVNAISRMSETEFKNSVIESLGWRDKARVKLLQSSFKVSSTTSNHLKITVRGLSSTDAQQAVYAALAVLADIHNGLLDKISAPIDLKLSEVEADLTDSKAYLIDLERMGKVSTQPCVKFAIFKSIMEEKRRLRDQQKIQFALMELRNLALTKRTMAVGAPFVSDRSVYPKVQRVWIFAIFIGLILGAMLVTLRLINRENFGDGLGVAVPVNDKAIT